MRNPVYIGKIVIPKLKDEESYTVEGLHDALIRPSVFYEVQDVLEGRKRKLGTKIVTQDMLALKGFVICPNCSKVLTGSASKGRKAHIIITIAMQPAVTGHGRRKPTVYLRNI